MSKKRKDRINESFVLHTLTMRRSPAWQVLPDHARRVLSRLEDEHMIHGGAANGNLPCTHKDFIAAGVPKKAVALAIRQCEATGFVEVTHKGTPSISVYRNPSRFRLTYLYGKNVIINGVSTSLRTDEWKRHETLEQAMEALASAKAIKSALHVSRAKTRKVRAVA